MRVRSVFYLYAIKFARALRVLLRKTDDALSGIVSCSSAAAITGRCAALFKAARNGSIACIVIDLVMRSACTVLGTIYDGVTIAVCRVCAGSIIIDCIEKAAMTSRWIR